MTDITEARIEAVARAICRSMGFNPDGVDPLRPGWKTWFDCKIIAGAALEADARWVAENKPKPTLGAPLQTGAPIAHGFAHNSKGSRSMTKYADFKIKLEKLINSESMENGSNTPDFILAQYLTNCLIDFDTAMTARAKWYNPPGVPLVSCGDTNSLLLSPEERADFEAWRDARKAP